MVAGGRQGLGHFGHVADVEVIRLPRAKPVPLPQQLGDLLDGGGDFLGGATRGQDLIHVGEAHRLGRVGGLGGRWHGIKLVLSIGVDLVETIHRRGGAGTGGTGAGALVGGGRRRAGHPEFDRRPGGEQDVVLIHAHHVGALGGEDADHLEGDVLDADFLADGGFALEQLPDERLAEHADLAGVADIPIGEHVAFGQAPFPDVEEGGSGAVDKGGHPVAVAVDDLGPGPDDRAPNP